MSRSAFRKGQAVTWAWGAHTAHGSVVERFDRRVQRTFKGTRVRRNGSAANPAYLVEQEGGDRVLKLGSELTAS